MTKAKPITLDDAKALIDGFISGSRIQMQTLQRSCTVLLAECERLERGWDQATETANQMELERNQSRADLTSTRLMVETQKAWIKKVLPVLEFIGEMECECRDDPDDIYDCHRCRIQERLTKVISSAAFDGGKG